MKLKTFRGGIHIKGYKWITEGLAIEDLPLPEKVRIPVNQHFGKPALPIVKSGDMVKTGQVIAVFQGKLSSNIHSSISGRVISISKKPTPIGPDSLSIEIESDGRDEIAGHMREDSELSYIEKAGIVGLGGAMFPTAVKLQPPAGKKVDAVIVNGAECEPYITCDYRLMIEESDKILKGLEIVMRILKAQTAYIAIESNKPKAINLMKNKLKGNRNINICALKTKYPQGGEKQLIKAVLNREVPSGGLPFDVGAVVQNVSTLMAIYNAVILGKPLYERVLTVTGSAVKNPGNYKVRIGALFSDIVELKHNPGRIVMGGPMMGLAQSTLDVPVIKGTNAILVMDKGEIRNSNKDVCIRCGKCVANCPMGLWPGKIADLIEKGHIDEAREFGFKDCIECGICAYLCPSNRDIVQLIKYVKKL